MHEPTDESGSIEGVRQVAESGRVGGPLLESSSTTSLDSSDWLSILVNPQPIRAIFGDFIPSLANIEVHDLLIGADGPSIHLRFDLPDYPSIPPRKWVEAQANRVQLRLYAFDVHQLTLAGIGWRSAATATLVRQGSGVRLLLTGADLHVDALVGWVHADKISAYMNDEAQPALNPPV